MAALPHDEPPPGLFQFRCLGSVTLLRPDGAKCGFRTRKQLALFLLLVRRSGQAVSREVALELLWSEDAESRGRHSLSQAISLINKMLGAETVRARGEGQLVLPAGVVWADVSEFEKRIAEKRYADAVSLWRGGLLEGPSVRRAPNFDRWLDAERRRLIEAMRRALHELVAMRRAEGRWDAMRDVASRLLDLDPLDEVGMLGYLEATTLLGDRSLALERYVEFERRLADELGAEPGPELRDLATRLRRGRVAGASGLAVHEDPSRPMAQVPAIPGVADFVGRAAAYGSLWQNWSGVRNGRGSCVVVVGGQGIGKTALVARLATQAQVASGSVCFVRCFLPERCVPFGPVSALVRQLASLPGFVAVAPTWLTELARLAPELLDRFPEAPRPIASDDSVRQRVCEGVLQALDAVAFERSTLIVVDDVQDADETTLALLHYVARGIGRSRILLLCVARAQEAAEIEIPTEELRRACQDGIAQTHVVGPMDDGEIGTIIERVLQRRGHEPARATVETLVSLAQGNPLHATELALAVPERAAESAAHWLAEFVRARPGPGLASFAHSVHERFTRLSAESQLTGKVLAIAGRPLSDFELRGATGLATSALAAALFRLDGAAFAREADGRWTFAHDAYGVILRSLTAEDEARALHSRLASALAESAGHDPARQFELAQHLLEGGRAAEAKERALAAADFALSVGAMRERAEAIELALGVSADAETPGLMAELADCHLQLRNFADVDDVCARALSRADLDPALRHEFRYLEIAVDYYSGRVPLSRIPDPLQALLRESEETPFPHANDAAALLLRVADKTGRPEMVRATARRIRKAEVARPEGYSAHALFAAAYCFAKYYWPGRALPLLERARDQAQRDQNWDLEHACRDGIGTVLKQLGRFEESIAQTEISLALARRCQNPLNEHASLCNIAIGEMALGNFDAAAERLADAERIDARYPDWPMGMYRVINQGELWLMQWKFDQAEGAFRVGFEQARRVGLWPMCLESAGGVALCGQRTGRQSVLSEWAREGLRLAAGREQFFAERWMFEGAVAWYEATCAGGQGTAAALGRIRRVARELSRRDVDHWLTLELEAIRIAEHTEGRRLEGARRTLEQTCTAHKAAGIAAECRA